MTIAVPTELHRDIALPFLEAGRSGAGREADGAIADRGRRDDCRGGAPACALAVGQTERFNPAVEAARPLLRDPRFIEVHRLGTFPERSLDIDVVFDLMIHDLDVVLSLVQAEVESIEAVGVPVLTGRVDIANARLRFANGCIANLTASRISRDRVRKIRFFQPAAYLSIDYAAQKVEMWRLVKGDGADAVDSRAAKCGRERGAAQARARGLRRRGRDAARAAGRPAPRAAARSRWRRGCRKMPMHARNHEDTKARSHMPEASCLRVFVASCLLSMYSDLNDFLADLEKRKLLARIAEPVSPDLEIAAVTDRACKSPGGGPALLFEKPTGFDMPVASNMFGSMERMCLALGVKTLDDLATEIDQLMTPQMPEGHHGRAEDAADGRPAARSDAEDGEGRAVPGDRPAATARSTSCRSSRAGPKTAAASSRCRWSSPRIRRPACETSAPIACRCSTAARPACTGSGTRAARSITAWRSGSAGGSTSPSRSARSRCCRIAPRRRCPKGSTSCCSAAFSRGAGSRW